MAAVRRQSQPLAAGRFQRRRRYSSFLPTLQAIRCLAIDAQKLICSCRIFTRMSRTAPQCNKCAERPSKTVGARTASNAGDQKIGHSKFQGASKICPGPLAQDSIVLSGQATPARHRCSMRSTSASARDGSRPSRTQTSTTSTYRSRYRSQSTWRPRQARGRTRRGCPSTAPVRSKN